ncbi:lanthionine synthetase LanC family protein [Stackebrandtia nassauensis]|uniref:Lanthionine synthetase C family protein n=1 Tax=Stackebrandtia nassauensis (strain DSM 44728 / CIP 108903 / NRRL B-16338 / NBRC 102104 / LLR-40K-21) TaxID=446470 RepID=D3Q1T8_STANL|nr:lanthionine synthetase LanC family protein [Stackebrandtia nassauensis]ADD39936.1 Lanthionine synthetase C family protein [Stackebrandtia nassauensis DSM 44728]
MNETRTPEELGRGGLDWLLTTARQTDDGLAWPVQPSADNVDHMLYWGTPGIVVAMLEGQRHFGDDRYGDAAARGATAMAAAITDCEGSSLYTGTTGLAVTLHAVGEQLGDDEYTAAATRALKLTRSRFDGTRWGELFELLLGNAGIALGAKYCGDLDLAVDALEPYLRTAEPTEHGVQWEHRPGAESRMHHFSHGTLGIAHALAEIGAAANRPDFTELALAGVADVVARDEAGPDGFLVPHSDPWDDTRQASRYNYGWCHGPAGDAHVFRLLRDLTGDPQWTALADRCWHTITHSGLPRRTRPGFWDNNGRCCGTASVLALANDRLVERDDDPAFAQVLVDDLAQRATVTDTGVCWSNVEHSADPSELEPQTGWAMGNAGIVRELLRYSRIRSGGQSGYAVGLPDQPAART